MRLTAYILVLAACSSTTSNTVMTAATLPPTSGTTEELTSTTAGNPTSITTTPRIGDLAMKPGAEIGPGEPWEVCGGYYPGREVQVVLSKPDTDLSWLPENEIHVVPTSEEGTFCWSGTFPSQMRNAMTGEVSPIEPGLWELIARDTVTGQDFARVDVRVQG